MSNIELYWGDCLKIMDGLIADGVKVDAIITDPPYGINYQSCWIKDKNKRKNKILNDKTPFYHFIDKIPFLLKDKYSLHIFTKWNVQQIFIDEMNKNNLKCKNIIIWDKVVHGMGDLKTSYGSRYESILFSSSKNFRFNHKRPTDIIKSQRVNPSFLLHPNEKPVSLLENIINDCVPLKGTVLDPFMGSGTTGVACKRTGRNFIGIELDLNYYMIAQERINKNPS